jgi:hypothetical protein
VDVEDLELFDEQDNMLNTENGYGEIEDKNAKDLQILPKTECNENIVSQPHVQNFSTANQFLRQEYNFENPFCYHFKRAKTVSRKTLLVIIDQKSKIKNMS